MSNRVKAEEFLEWEHDAFKRVGAVCRGEAKALVNQRTPEPMKAIAVASALVRHAAAQLIAFKAGTNAPNFRVSREKFLQMCARAYDAMADMSGFDEASQTTGVERMAAAVDQMVERASGGGSIDDAVEQDAKWDIPEGFFPGKGGDT